MSKPGLQLVQKVKLFKANDAQCFKHYSFSSHCDTELSWASEPQPHVTTIVQGFLSLWNSIALYMLYWHWLFISTAFLNWKAPLGHKLFKMQTVQSQPQVLLYQGAHEVLWTKSRKACGNFGTDLNRAWLFPYCIHISQFLFILIHFYSHPTQSINLAV